MNITHKAEITVRVRGTTARCMIEAETINDMRDMIARLEHLERVFANVVPDTAPRPQPPFIPLNDMPAAHRKRWTPSAINEVQALLNKGADYAAIGRVTGRTPNAVQMAVHNGRLVLPANHPRRRRNSRRVSGYVQHTLPLATPADVLRVAQDMAASGALHHGG